MSGKIPWTTPPVWPATKPGRFAGQIAREYAADCAIALLGLPDDLGIKLNHGRVGAALGPRAFREALAKFGTVWDAARGKSLAAKVFDVGDVVPAAGTDEAALMQTHERVEAAVGALHELKVVPVCIGGGHDLTLPTVTALSKHLGRAVAGINFDAHLDVRQRVGSGMALRRLIETGRLDGRRLSVVGLGRFVNDEADCKWIVDRGASLIFGEEIGGAPLPIDRAMAGFDDGTPGFVSIDLDGIDGSSAPGVSAVNPMGLSVAQAAALAAAAGADARVRHLDIMELSPPFDQDNRTARVAALLFVSFVATFGARSA